MTRHLQTVLGVLALAIGTWSPVFLAQSDRSASYRAVVDLVEMDVAVLDKDRHPVRGLTAGDFTVFEDGKPQPVSAFTAVDLPGRAADAPGAAWMRDVAPDVRTNDALPDEGRLLVIFFDYTIPHGAAALAARNVARAAVRDLGAGDLAAIVYPLPGGSPHDFTNDRERLLAAIDGTYAGTESSLDVQSSLSDMTAELAADLGRNLSTEDVSGECYCGTCTHYAIARVADAVRDVGHRRKSLLFIGSNLATDVTSRLCGAHIQKALEVMFTAVDRAGLTVHAVDARGLETGSLGASWSGKGGNSVSTSIGRGRGIMPSQGNLAVLPDRTGGRTIKNTNAPEARVPAILAESDSYYLLGFEPAIRGDDKTHNLEVKVNRRGVSVKTRRSYIAAPPASASEHAANRAQLATEGVIAARAGLTLAASAAAMLTPATGEQFLAILIGARHDASAPETRPGRIDVVTSIRKMTGEEVSTLTQALDVMPAVGDEAAPRYEFVQRMPVTPGRYQVRIGVNNRARNQSGSLYTFVDVPDLKKTHLSLSDVVVRGEENPSSLSTAALDDVLPFSPTVRREFTRPAQVEAFLQIHQGASPLLPVSVTARVVDAGDRVRFEQHGALNVSEFQTTRTADCSIEVPLADFQSGEYLLTIEARAGALTASRRVRFAVK